MLIHSANCPDPTDLLRQLENERTLLDHLLGELPDPIFVFDQEGRHHYVNCTGATLLGTSPSDWPGKRWEDLGLAPEIGAAFLSWSKPIFASRSSTMMEQTLPTVDGPRVFECLLKPVLRWADQPLAMSCLRDITDRKRADEESKCALLREVQSRRTTEEAYARSQKFMVVSAALSICLTPSEVIEVILAQAVAVMGGTAGRVALLNQEKTHLEHRGAVGSTQDMPLPHLRLPLGADLPLSEAARTKQAVWIESEFALKIRYPRYIPWMDASLTRAMAAVPLIVDGQAIGAISVAFPQRREFSQEDRGFILVLAGQCAQALARARLYEEAKTGPWNAKPDTPPKRRSLRSSQMRKNREEILR